MSRSSKSTEPDLSQSEIDTLVDHIARNVPAAATSAAIGHPHHKLLAVLTADRQLRMSYAAALDSSATVIEDEVDRVTTEASLPGQSEHRVKVLMKRGDLLSQTAAGRRRLAVRMSGRILPDKVKGPYQPISRRQPKATATTQTAPTPSGPSPDYWAGKVARHLQKIEAAKPTSAPAPAAEPPQVITAGLVMSMNDQRFTALLQSLQVDRRRFDAAPRSAQMAVVNRGRKLGLLAQEPTPASA